MSVESQATTSFLFGKKYIGSIPFQATGESKDKKYVFVFKFDGSIGEYSKEKNKNTNCKLFFKESAESYFKTFFIDVSEYCESITIVNMSDKETYIVVNKQ